MSHSFSTDHIDYLQRAHWQPDSLAHVELDGAASPDLRRLLHVSGVGQTEKRTKPGAGAEASTSTDREAIRIATEDLLVGLYGYSIRLAFRVTGSEGTTSFELGTWMPQAQANTAVLDRRKDIIEAVLRATYPAVDFSNGGSPAPSRGRAGLVLGIPTVKSADPRERGAPMDRLVRALHGSGWECLVLAEPVDESATSEIRRSVIEEMRQARLAQDASHAAAPLVEHYSELLKSHLQSLTAGLSVGLWRTAVYLLGDDESYFRLASLWRGAFSGKDSLPEPVRVWDADGVARLADAWALPDVAAAAGPGHFRHPLQYQSLLTSRQLAAYVHLPKIETAGFSIRRIPEFDVVPRESSAGASIRVGDVLLSGKPAPGAYDVRIDDLTRHTFVTGVTGAGKTNTIFRLLEQVDEAEIPFLVLESAKKEYRALLVHPRLRDRLRVFTLGNENVTPLRMNPFEPLPGIPLSVHVDLLRSVFGASFGMWTPLPQVLEQCVHEIYQDRGWSIARNENHRLGDETPTTSSFPTLTDLAAKVDDVTRRLGYDERVTSDIRAALLTRINALRIGGKGRMLDIERSYPTEELMAHCTILELEALGDDDDKAFVIGLLLIRIAEYWRTRKPSRDTRHLLVVEEAHRLLANLGQQSREGEANPRGKAVESFVNLLSEIRAYGQGVVIADQVPVKLAPDAIKNTNLKIVHRVVAADDRQVLAGSMVMDESQAQSLSVLNRGEAVVFSEGDDGPLLVKVPLVKDVLADELPSDESVAKHMSQSGGRFGVAQPCPRCGSADDLSACEAAAEVADDAGFKRAFSRWMLSFIEDAGALQRGLGDMMRFVQRERPSRVAEAPMARCTFVRAAQGFVRRRGAQAGWPYAAADEICQLLVAVLSTLPEPPSASVEAFREAARRLHERTFDPFPFCSRICSQDRKPCLYRHAVRDLIDSRRLTAAWEAIMSASWGEPPARPGWEVSMDAGALVIELPDGRWSPAYARAGDAAARRASLCFGQQMLCDDPTLAGEGIARLMERLLADSRHEVASAHTGGGESHD